MQRFWKPQSRASSDDMHSRYVKPVQDQVFVVLPPNQGTDQNFGKPSAAEWEGGGYASPASSSSSSGFEMLRSIPKKRAKTAKTKKSKRKSRSRTSSDEVAGDGLGFQLVARTSNTSLEEYASAGSKELAKNKKTKQSKNRVASSSSSDSNKKERPQNKKERSKRKRKKKQASGDSNYALEQMLAESSGIPVHIAIDPNHESGKLTATTRPESGSSGSENRDSGHRRPTAETQNKKGRRKNRSYSQKNLLETSGGGSSDSSISVSVESERKRRHRQKGKMLLGEMSPQTASEDEIPTRPVRSTEIFEPEESTDIFAQGSSSSDDGMAEDGLFGSDDDEQKEALSSPYLKKRQFISGDNWNNSVESFTDSFVVLEERFRDEYNNGSGRSASMHRSSISQFADESNRSASLHRSSINQFRDDSNRSASLHRSSINQFRDDSNRSSSMHRSSISQSRDESNRSSSLHRSSISQFRDEYNSSSNESSTLHRSQGSSLHHSHSSNISSESLSQLVVDELDNSKRSRSVAFTMENKKKRRRPKRGGKKKPKSILKNSKEKRAVAGPTYEANLDDKVPASSPAAKTRDQETPSNNQQKRTTFANALFVPPGAETSTVQAVGSSPSESKLYPTPPPLSPAYTDNPDSEIGTPTSSSFDSTQPLTGGTPQKRKKKRRQVCSGKACLFIAFINLMLLALVVGLGVVLFLIVFDDDDNDGKPTSNPTSAPPTLPMANETVPTATPSVRVPTLSPQPTISQSPTATWRLWEDADWRGSIAQENLGSTVALSPDGRVLAIVSSTSTTKEVQIYHRVRANDYSDWVFKGAPIASSQIDDDFGFHIVLDQTGDRVVIGAPNALDGLGEIYTYDFSDNDWILTTKLTGVQTFVGRVGSEVGGTQLGGTFDLSSDGNILLTGEPMYLRRTGRVRLFQFHSGQWIQLDFSTSGLGFGVGDELGNSVSLSANGLRIAFGSVGSDNASTDSGRVTILDYTPPAFSGEGGTTSIVGRNTPIKGLVSAQGFGSKVALSEDGQSLVASSRIGNVRVFRLESQIDFWLDVLDTVEFEPDQFSIASTNAGFSVVFTFSVCPSNETCDWDGKLGFVRVLDFVNNRFVRRPGSDLVGLPMEGGSVALASSDEATVLAVGLPGETVNDLDGAGAVRVYQYRGS